MGIGWYRLVRARRSQLLLRSATVPQRPARPRPAAQASESGAAIDPKEETDKPKAGDKKDGSEI